MRQLIFLIFFLQFNLFVLEAQDLSNHQWENRILLIQTDDKTQPIYQQQITVLKGEKTGLTERKLVVYQIFKDSYKLGLDEASEWKKAEDSFLNLVKSKKRTQSDFSILLIGLDGGVKLNQEAVLTTEELFRIIDAMPMRMLELKGQR